MRNRRQYREFLKLAGMIVCVPLVAWWFGFRQTISMWRECRARQDELRLLHRKNSGQPVAFYGENVSAREVLNNGVLLERLSEVMKKNGVRTVRYTPYLTREEGSLQIHTGELVLSGGFIPLLKVADRMERDGALGKMVGCGFRMVPDRAKKEKQLCMTLVIQQLTMKKQK